MQSGRENAADDVSDRAAGFRCQGAAKVRGFGTDLAERTATRTRRSLPKWIARHGFGNILAQPRSQLIGNLTSAESQSISADCVLGG